jgi:hypothetical protein
MSRLTLFQVMLAWVSMAPLARPVVPEVYRIMPVSPGSTGSSKVDTGGGARICSYGSPRGTVGVSTSLTRPAQDGATIRIRAPQSLSW